jgi:hypothetical protein
VAACCCHHRLQIIPLDPVGRVSEAFNVRLEELGVVDIALLAGREQGAGGTGVFAATCHVGGFSIRAAYNTPR